MTEKGGAKAGRQATASHSQAALGATDIRRNTGMAQVELASNCCIVVVATGAASGDAALRCVTVTLLSPRCEAVVLHIMLGSHAPVHAYATAAAFE